MKVDYKLAGVDIEAGNATVARIKKNVESTFAPQVLSSIGGFSAMYDISEIAAYYQYPVLVQSIDGVGTKMMIAKMMNKYDTIGIDLVSATANDIVVIGAKPLTLLDYIANDKLNPDVVEKIIDGMTTACRELNISLVGGETAEMPGTYVAGEHDLVGVITGVVERDGAILGKDIEVGDAVVAFPSSGLHTNGYSLARKLLFDVAGYNCATKLPELHASLGDTLLTPHINYTRPVLDLLANGIHIKGMAHITGGGVLENIPRVLPANCSVEIDKSACPSLPIFDVLCRLGDLSEYEAYRTFNMGIGFVMIVPAEAIPLMRDALSDEPGYPLYEIGRVVAGQKDVRLI